MTASGGGFDGRALAWFERVEECHIPILTSHGRGNRVTRNGVWDYRPGTIE
jgi:hypothetical protein